MDATALTFAGEALNGQLGLAAREQLATGQCSSSSKNKRPADSQLHNGHPKQHRGHDTAGVKAAALTVPPGGLQHASQVSQTGQFVVPRVHLWLHGDIMPVLIQSEVHPSCLDLKMSLM